MKLWIARDKDSSLSVCSHKQVYDDFLDSWKEPIDYYSDDYSFHAYIPEHLFPEVTFENSPMKVELKLV